MTATFTFSRKVTAVKCFGTKDKIFNWGSRIPAAGLSLASLPSNRPQCDVRSDTFEPSECQKPLESSSRLPRLPRMSPRSDRRRRALTPRTARVLSVSPCPSRRHPCAGTPTHRHREDTCTRARRHVDRQQQVRGISSNNICILLYENISGPGIWRPSPVLAWTPSPKTLLQ